MKRENDFNNPGVLAILFGCIVMTVGLFLPFIIYTNPDFDTQADNYFNGSMAGKVILALAVLAVVLTLAAAKSDSVKFAKRSAWAPILAGALCILCCMVITSTGSAEYSYQKDGSEAVEKVVFDLARGNGFYLVFIGGVTAVLGGFLRIWTTKIRSGSAK